VICIKVALNLPLNQLFYYKVPEELAGEVEVGKRVLVPFKKKKLIGFIMEKLKEEHENLREIIKIFDDLPPIKNNLLLLGSWIAKYYCCSTGQALHSVLPIQYPFKVIARSRECHCEGQDSSSVIAKDKVPKQSNLLPFSLLKDDEYRNGINALFKEKNVALLKVGDWEKRIDLYLELIKWGLKENRQVILIVPEVSYIPSLQKALQNLYKDKLSIFHSKLTPKQRYEQWRRMKIGEANLAIGTRSVVFSPFPKIGLILIEEEENLAYKQIEVPRYHVREVAIKRGEIENFPVVLFTQSPSLESWQRVKKGAYKLVELPRHNGNFPLVEIVDLRRQRDRIFSSTLTRRMRQELEEDRPTLLFLSRRGYANFLLCRECGEVIRCPNCNIGLTFHLRDNLQYKNFSPTPRGSPSSILICHYCGYQQEAPRLCPLCKGRQLRGVGTGTEKVEVEARKRFPGISIRRVDLDVITSLSARKHLLNDLNKRKGNLLIGTQLIIKEEILRRASLVGVILIDTLLNLPDFRAGEHVFQLLTKIKKLMKEDGKIIIQTYNPTHFALSTLKEGKEEAYYEEEMKIRKELGYPPYLHWVRILLEGRNKGRVGEIARKIEEKLKGGRVSFLGPSPCPFGKIKGRYRYHLVLRDESLAKIRDVLEKKLDSLLTHFHGVKVAIDVDPLRTM